MQQRLQPSLRTARIIAGALPGGVVLFWIVGWVITGGGQAGTVLEALSPEQAFWLWVVAALVGFSGALFFRNRALRVVEGFARDGEGPAIEMVGAVQTNLIIAWTLLEGPALLSGVFFVLLAMKQVLWIAVPLYLVGVILTFPRVEWFGEDPERMRSW